MGHTEVLNRAREAGVSRAARECLLYMLSIGGRADVDELAGWMEVTPRRVYQLLAELRKHNLANATPQQFSVPGVAVPPAPDFAEVKSEGVQDAPDFKKVKSADAGFHSGGAVFHKSEIESGAGGPFPPPHTPPSYNPPAAANEGLDEERRTEPEPAAAAAASQPNEPEPEPFEGLDYGNAWFCCYNREPSADDEARLTSLFRRCHQHGVTLTEADLKAAAERARREWRADGRRTGDPQGANWFFNALAAIISERRRQNESPPAAEPKPRGLTLDDFRRACLAGEWYPPNFRILFEREGLIPPESAGRSVGRA